MRAGAHAPTPVPALSRRRAARRGRPSSSSQVSGGRRELLPRASPAAGLAAIGRRAAGCRASAVRARSSRPPRRKSSDRQRRRRRTRTRVGPARDVVVARARRRRCTTTRRARRRASTSPRPGDAARPAASAPARRARAVNSSSARSASASGSSSSRVASPMQDRRPDRGRRRQALGAAAASRRPSGPRSAQGALSVAVAVGELAPATAAAPPRRRARRSAARARASIAASARSSSKAASAPTSTCVSALSDLARAGDGRGDRQPLLQRVAQRGDLAVRVEAVLARRALRLRVAEAPLPRTERVRADVQDGSRLGGLQRARTARGSRPLIDAERSLRFQLCTTSVAEPVQKLPKTATMRRAYGGSPAPWSTPSKDGTHVRQRSLVPCVGPTFLAIATPETPCTSAVDSAPPELQKLHRTCRSRPPRPEARMYVSGR